VRESATVLRAEGRGVRFQGQAIGRALVLLRSYAELTKVRLTSLVVATAGVGFVMAGRSPLDASTLAWTVLGTALAAAGSMALNQVIEADRDARMERTKSRPLPGGAIGRRHALLVGLITASVGLILLAVRVRPLTAVLGLAVVLIYTLVYTPLKPRTPLCTLVGGICGAIPPMMGWTATGAGLSFGAWVLAGVLFLWQIPHFLALAWMYRDDYRRGGFRMLPVVDPSGRATGLIAVLYSLALLPVGLPAILGGMTGWLFVVGSLALGAGLVTLALCLAAFRSEPVARRLFLATLAYLPLLLGLMVADRVPEAARLTLAKLVVR
jgi:protoheme IX farnesyltransferase